MSFTIFIFGTSLFFTGMITGIIFGVYIERKRILKILKFFGLSDEKPETSVA